MRDAPSAEKDRLGENSNPPAPKVREEAGTLTQIRFTVHGSYRLQQRSELRRSEVKALLLENRVVHIGREKGTDRDHLLFYSAPDEECCVAVMDNRTKEIVTVLTADIHAQICWRVPQRLRAEARYAALSTEPPAKRADDAPIEERIAKRDFRPIEIEIRFTNVAGKRTKLTIDNAPAYTPESALERPALLKKIEETIARLKEQKGSNFQLAYRARKGMEVTLFDEEIHRRILRG